MKEDKNFEWILKSIYKGFKMKEKRKARRIDVNIDIIIDRIDKDSISRGKIINLSSGGVCLITDYDLPVSVHINLIFHLPIFGEVIGITGEITWNEFSIENDFFYCGVKFIKIPGKYKDFILEHINNSFFDIRNKGISY